MKKILFIVMVVLAMTFSYSEAQMRLHGLQRGIPSGAGDPLRHPSTGGGVIGTPACDDNTGMLVAEDFEGTGTPTDWTTNVPESATADFDDTTATILRGSQQLKLAGASSSSVEARTPAFAASSTVWVAFQYKPTDATPATSHQFIGLYDSGGTIRASVDIRTTGEIRVYHGASYLQTDGTAACTAENTPWPGCTGSGSGVALGNGEKIYGWFQYTAGSGANGTYSLYLSTTRTIPETAALSGSNGTSTADIVYVYAREYNNTTGGAYFDQIRVKASAIGTLCE